LSRGITPLDFFFIKLHVKAWTYPYTSRQSWICS